jgi:hypothetical protein
LKTRVGRLAQLARMSLDVFVVPVALHALAMHPISRSMAIAEALTGQLYVAVLIARFVTTGPHRGAVHGAA